MKRINVLVIAMFALMLPMMAHAQDVTVGGFLDQILEAVKGFGGLSWVGKVSTVVLLVIASMKVSMIKPLWEKLGNFKAAAAPILGLIGGLLSIGAAQGSLPTLAQALAYLGAGAGAIMLHEVLDMIKAIPGIGPMWVTVINMIEGALGGSK